MVAAGSDDMTRLGFVLASDSCIGCPARARPARSGPGNLRRPLWFARPMKPVATAYLYTNPDPASVES